MTKHTTTEAGSSSSVFGLQSLPAQNLCEKNDELAGLEESSPPDTVAEVLQKWNSPRINMFRVPATFWSFFVVGMNDGSYGVSLSISPAFQMQIRAGLSSARMTVPLSLE